MKELDIGWQFIKGGIPILLVASHNFPHLREGILKPRDLWTGDLVRKFCKRFDCFGIVSTKIQKDPNWYTNSPFRKTVINIIKNNNIQVVIDIHGRKLNSKHLIELHSNDTFYNNYSDLINTFFMGKLKDDEQLTLTENFEKISVAGVEIEIREDGRVPTINPKNYDAALKRIEHFLSRIIEETINQKTFRRTYPDVRR